VVTSIQVCSWPSAAVGVEVAGEHAGQGDGAVLPGGQVVELRHEGALEELAGVGGVLAAGLGPLAGHGLLAGLLALAEGRRLGLRGLQGAAGGGVVFLPLRPETGQPPGVLEDGHVGANGDDDVDVEVALEVADLRAVDESSVHDEDLDDPAAYGAHEPLDERPEGRGLRLVGVEDPQAGDDESLSRPVAVEEEDGLVAPPPAAAGPLGLRHLGLSLGVDGVVVLVEEEPHGALVAGIVGHEKVGAVADEHPGRIVGAELPVEPRHRTVVPRLEGLGVGVLGDLAQGVLVAGGRAGIDVPGVEPRTPDRQAARLGVHLSAGELGPERIEEPSRADDQGVAVEAVRAVEPHRHLAGDVHPQGDVVALPRRGILGGQPAHDVLVEEEPEELGLRHVRGQLDVVEAALAELVDDVGLVVLEDHEIHSCTSLCEPGRRERDMPVRPSSRRLTAPGSEGRGTCARPARAAAPRCDRSRPASGG
jgi:hypothetical protein